MPRAQGCARTARARLASLVPRPRLNLTRFHGVFAPNFKLRPKIVPRRARVRVDADKPSAPMSWPLSHIPVLRGTGTSSPRDAAPEARIRHAPGHLLLMLRMAQASLSTGTQSHLLNSPRRHRDLSRAPAKLKWRFASLLARSPGRVPISACGGTLRVIGCTRRDLTRARATALRSYLFQQS
jgi:hypothetical protein